MTKTKVGIDVGDHSVGLASVICREDGFPERLHRLVVVLHDGGKDDMATKGSTGSVTRKASGGSARRARRLLRNRRRRSRRLRAELHSRRYPLIDPDTLGTYEAWQTRIELLDHRIRGEVERRRKISVAIEHMSRHRGYANAWTELETYWHNDSPSEMFQQAVEDLVIDERFGEISRNQFRFQADIAALGLTRLERLRPLDPREPGTDAVDHTHLLGTQQRVDVVREWMAICSVQRVATDECETLAKIAFRQERPKVPIETVGNDWLPGMTGQKRASRSALEHQEFYIRQAVANLAVRSTPRSKVRRRLTVGEQNQIVDALMAVTMKAKAPTWRQIAELLDIPGSLLVHADPEQSLSGIAPTMRSIAVLYELPKRHPVLAAWRDWSPSERRDFLEWLADPAEGRREAELGLMFSALLGTLTDDQLKQLTTLTFPDGRSAHCSDALMKMSAEIKETGDPYVTVRNRLFGNGSDIKPVGTTLDVEASHPTLQRVLPTVRRFLNGVTRELGAPPDQIVIEHVRDAFSGFTAKREAAMRQRRNQRHREQAELDIRSAGLGIDRPTRGQIRAYQARKRQQSQCLYCGATLLPGGTQLDHIVPRFSGGNSTHSNLVAVCVACNQAKGKEPFAVFAASGKRPGVSLADAIGRVAAMSRDGFDSGSFRRLQRDMRQRLQQTAEDEGIDERSLASTAYAAVDMRERIDGTYATEARPNITKVYSGRVVSMARHASGIDKRIRLRQGVECKSRFDRRHHAVDAAVAAMITPAVARILAVRDDLRQAAHYTDSGRDWVEQLEDSLTKGEQKSWQAWKEGMCRLAELIEDAVINDEIVVTQQVRYSARHGALHEDGRTPHARKALGGAWTSKERMSIVDDRVYAAVADGALPSQDLPADPGRRIVLPGGRRLTAEEDVLVFAGNGARIALPGSSSAGLGHTLHHVRLYRWLDPRDRWQAGVVRVFASDLYDLEGGAGGDILRSPLRHTSRAVRRSHLRLQDAITMGIAEQVGFFMPRDEILLDPVEWAAETEFGKFLEVWPETHWRIVGWGEDSRASLNPLYLSGEGIPASGPGSTNPRFVSVLASEAKVIKDRARVPVKMLYSTPGTRVIRRTGLGRVRDRPSAGLPVSWSPHQAVLEA